jgi:hypothetical protein
MKLFEKLDAAYARNPDPDAVAKSFGRGGWVKCSEISRNFFEENKRVPYVIGVFNPETLELRSISGKGARGWYFTHCASSWGSFISTLSRAAGGGHYWMIPQSEYREGDHP